MTDQWALEVKHLSKTVKDITGEISILKDINFTLEKSHTLAIIGASGSGKSTLLGLLAGLDLPTSGEVVLMGKSLFNLNEDERAQLRAQLVGFVFQNFHLLPNLTALENVMLPLELLNKSAKDAAQASLEHVGLDARMSHYPKTLSGGERQRVALARAFVVQPAILFADEPTGSLDEQTGVKIIELMFSLQSEYGTTLVLVTHDKQLAARCQHQLQLHDGQIIA